MLAASQIEKVRNVMVAPGTLAHRRAAKLRPK